MILPQCSLNGIPLHYTVQAVKNRKEYFKKIVVKNLKQGDLLNIANGPARDLYEYYKKSKNSFVKCTCIEMDAEAIKHEKRLNKDYLNNIEFINKNIFRFNTDNKFNLLWSARLFDYFDDKAFTLLLNRL